MQPPLLLDFDQSILSLKKEEIRIPLQEWQESIRFGCTLTEYTKLTKYLSPLLPEQYGTVFMGSGDYHHLTLFLLQQCIARNPDISFDLVVADNHPDNMRYPFGIHCGSWISHAAKLPQVAHIHVIGITSSDIGSSHAWENYLTPFLREKLTYWSLKSHASWLGLLGKGCHSRVFSSPDNLLSALKKVLEETKNIYLSIDKDVLSPETVHTNWDQGIFTFLHLENLSKICQARLIGSDITGEVSTYVFTTYFKRFLSWLDGQENIEEKNIVLWQNDHKDLNIQLLKLLSAS